MCRFSIDNAARFFVSQPLLNRSLTGAGKRLIYGGASYICRICQYRLELLFRELLGDLAELGNGFDFTHFTPLLWPPRGAKWKGVRHRKPDHQVMTDPEVRH